VNADRPDAVLIEAFRQGEAAALDGLVERHLRGVWGLAFQLTLSPAAADDLTQETFLRAIRGLSNYRGEAAFRTWLFRIMVNVSRDLHATAAKQAVDLLSAGAEPAARSHETPERAVMQVELEQEINQALAELPEHLRLAMALTAMQGLTPDEAADVEGCTTSTIYWRIHEARKLLRKRLEVWLQ
jgi:RNA polymerase sigma-70 factor (ECF subfamily)